jgi:hypothetical protein
MAIILPSETIYAALKSSKIPQQKSGIGTIEVTDKGVFLKTAGERIPIENPENAHLQNGQTVRYTVKNDTLQITPLPPDPRPAPDLPADLLTLTASESSASPSLSVRAAAVFPVENVEPGIYLLTSPDDLKALSSATLNRETLDLIKTGIATDGAIALRIENSADGIFRAVILSTDNLPIAFRQLCASFTSAPFSSLSPDILMSLLVDRGNLPFAPLLQIDALLQTVETAFPSIRAGSAEAQDTALRQWLLSVLCSDPSGDTVACAPRVSAGTLMSDLQPVLSALADRSGIVLPQAGIFPPPSESTDNNKQNTSPLSAAVNRMGFTLEHSLVTDRPEQPHLPQSTLKSLLLHFLGAIQGDRDSVSAPAPKPGSSRSTPPSQPEAASTPGSKSSVEIQKSENLVRVVSELRAAIAATTHPTLQNTSIPGNRSSEQLQQQSSGSPGKSAVSTAPQSETVAQGEATSPTPDRLAVIKNIINQASSALALYREQPGIATPAAAALTRLIDSIRMLAEKIEAPAAKSGNQTAPPQSVPAALQQNPATTLMPLLKNTLDAIDSMLRLLQSTSTDVSGAARSDTFALRERSSIGQTVSGDAATDGEFSRPHTARILGTALERLESLQLLARQVSTSQGTQQIIALPIKFDETWTEINVRFLHRKKKQRTTKKNAPLSVAIDVAPPVLGAIHAHLDYRPTRAMHLAIDFERKNTRSWFVNHRTELQNALHSAGITTVSIDLRHLRPKAAPSGDSDAGNGTALIDMKV